jgi:hypothetical protein
MSTRALHVLFVLGGAAGLLVAGRYSGPWAEAVHNWGGNVSVSFAVYLLAARLTRQGRFGALRSAALALAAVELFEVLDGFGFMANVYDSWDLLANALGVALGAAVDAVSARLLASRVGQRGGRP